MLSRDLLIHSTRLALSALLATIIGLYWNLGHMYWLMFTVVLVLQGEIGSSIKRSFERLSGTLIGAPLGIAVVAAIGAYHIGILSALLALMFIAIVFLMQKHYAFAVILITAAIVIAYGISGDTELSYTAFSRVFDTFLGTIIALAVSITVFPRSINKALLREWIAFLRGSGDMYELIVGAMREKGADSKEWDSRKKYIDSAASILKKAEESVWESGIIGSGRVQKELRENMVRSSMLLVNRYIEMGSLAYDGIRLDEALKDSLELYGSGVKEAFYALAESYENGELPSINIEPFKKELENELEKMLKVIENISDKEERRRVLVKIAVFYEQTLGVLEAIE